MLKLIDYVEQYLKKEGLSGKIPSSHTQKLPPTAAILIWFGGTWILSIGLHWYFIGFRKIIYSLICPGLILILLFFILVIYYGIKQYKSKLPSGLSADKIGGIILLYYPVLLIISFGVITRNLLGTGILFVGFILLLGLLFLFNTTLIFQTLINSARVSIGIFAKSISVLLTIIPILLLVVLIPIFSQDFWLILGNISWNRLIIVMLLFTIPVIILTYMRSKRGTMQFIGELPPLEKIPDLFYKIEFFEDKFRKGLISHREWKKVREDLLWRNNVKIAEVNKPWLYKILKNRLTYFSIVTFLLLFIAFFVYFVILFNFLLPPETISSWAGVHLTFISLTLYINNISILIPSTIIQIVKLSIVLSIIVALTSQIYTLTDNDFRTNVLSWLENKAQNWLITSTIYDCLLTPNYQLWKYKVNNKKILNAEIIVKPDQELSIINTACRNASSMASSSVYLIIVSCFEAIESMKIDHGYPKKHWRLLINRAKQIDDFSDLSVDTSEVLRINDSLGFELIDQNKPIPDEWFGDEQLACTMGKAFWDSDQEHNLIQHPHVDKSSQNYICEIALTRILDNSKQYMEFIKSLLAIALPVIPDFENITIRLYFHDSNEDLASFDYFAKTDQVIYKDHLSKSYKYSDIKNWIKQEIPSK